IVRDPYDTFVSMFYWLQTRSKYDASRGKVRPRERPKDTLIGKELGDPEVLEFLATTFGEYIRRANDWTHSGRAVVARYENLHADQVAELIKVTNQIKPVDLETIERAIEACKAENMKSMSKKMSTHIRSAKVGDSKEKLSQAHYDIFRENYADLITGLGYEVR
ncbi:MAG: sulfotransferase domain-containing protein, partial [Thermomicrobiales bacterium]